MSKIKSAVVYLPLKSVDFGKHWVDTAARSRFRKPSCRQTAYGIMGDVDKKQRACMFRSALLKHLKKSHEHK
jgi:hypothetical protein